ncbi:MAG TPA: methionine aminopeptidase [Terrimesophilobacter sp.]|nr:methionine aminopeptidase [Terrimesophilobacter sp.]
MTHWNGREPEVEWWYNSRTGQVEEGPQSLAADRIGPFDTREDAERAPEIIAERARAWADEEAEEDDWRD